MKLCVNMYNIKLKKNNKEYSTVIANYVRNKHDFLLKRQKERLKKKYTMMGLGLKLWAIYSFFHFFPNCLSSGSTTFTKPGSECWLCHLSRSPLLPCQLLRGLAGT